MRLRSFAAALAAAVALAAAGCSSLRPPRSVSPNPLIVPTDDVEAIWKQAVAVLDEYFEIARENRAAGTIETNPTMGSNLAEPWNGDSVGFDQRLESTLQTIRRFARVTIKPAPGGGHTVKVEVYKELEDLVKPERQAGGRANFTSDFPVNRTRDIVGPVPVAPQWIPRGRDPKLEQVILARIRSNLFF